MNKEAKFSKTLSLHLMQNKYNEAKIMIEGEMRNNRNDPWLISNYAIVLYELRDYKKALMYSSKAIKSEKNDPLFLNYHAVILNANNRENDAAKIWKYLLNRDIRKLAFEDCQEGILWVKSLQNDIRFSLALLYKSINNFKLAKKYIQEHLKYRTRGQFSLHTKKDAVKMLNEL